MANPLKRSNDLKRAAEADPASNGVLTEWTSGTDGLRLSRRSEHSMDNESQTSPTKIRKRASRRLSRVRHYRDSIYLLPDRHNPILWSFQLLSLVVVVGTMIYTGRQASEATKQTSLLATQVSASLSSADLVSKAYIITYPDDVINPLKSAINEEFENKRSQLQATEYGLTLAQIYERLLPISRKLPLLPPVITITIENTGAEAATSVRIWVEWLGEISNLEVDSPTPYIVEDGGIGHSKAVLKIEQLHQGSDAWVQVTFAPSTSGDLLVFDTVREPDTGDTGIDFGAYMSAGPHPPQFRLEFHPDNRTHEELSIDIASDQTRLQEVPVTPGDLFGVIGILDVLQDYPGYFIQEPFDWSP